jgi:hypothetical protein
VARTYHLPPSAASLTASLRDLGYSLETAIADLIDNSVTADATEIDVFLDSNGKEPFLVVADNGNGMNEQTLISAMRHGTGNPKAFRSPKDLGRFGLGLKTASFSQCTRLSVVSRQNDSTAGAEWDLDRIEREDDWNLLLLEKHEIREVPMYASLGKQGTLVIWRNLDRLFEDNTGGPRDEIADEKLMLLERHLSLVFHRFLSGDVKGRNKLVIRINGHRIKAFDPFCRSYETTQILPLETVVVNGTTVTMQAYILPHFSNLTKADEEFYNERSNFLSNQGAYIYRNGRLMAWGDWFRLVPKGESTKLARVQVDFPNSLDELWTIDIKKSRAHPPHAVKERLRQIIPKITIRSVAVHKGRGERLYDKQSAPLWNRYADYGSIRYEVNLDHPLVNAIASKLELDDAATFKTLLQSISAALPLEMLYSDYSTQPRDVSGPFIEEQEVIDRLFKLKSILDVDVSGDRNVFLDIVQSMKIFDNYTVTIQRFVREHFS